LTSCGKENCSKCSGEPEVAGDGLKVEWGHGPYWYMRFVRGRMRKWVYIGKDLDTRRYVTAAGTIDWTEYNERRRVRRARRKGEEKQAMKRVARGMIREKGVI